MVKKEQIFVFKTSADKIFQLEDFTSATILYFKTLFAIQEYILLQKIGSAPKDHSERFKLLKQEFPEEYLDLDLEFNTYRNTYSRLISKETCQRIKNMVENAINKNKLN